MERILLLAFGLCLMNAHVNSVNDRDGALKKLSMKEVIATLSGSLLVAPFAGATTTNSASYRNPMTLKASREYVEKTKEKLHHELKVVEYLQRETNLAISDAEQKSQQRISKFQREKYDELGKIKDSIMKEYADHDELSKLLEQAKQKEKEEHAKNWKFLTS